MTKNAEGVLLKKSKLTTNGKPNLPAPSKLVEGELAINYAEGVETISTKNESGTVVTFSSDDYFKNQYLAWEKGTGTGSAKLVSNSGTASGNFAVSEGQETIASGDATHAEGYATTAMTQGMPGVHAEGHMTYAGAGGAHAEGNMTSGTSTASHAEGNSTLASGIASHAEGGDTIAQNSFEHASGQFNISNSASTEFGDSGNTLFSVGNGTAEEARHNAFEIRQNGDIYIVNKDGNDVKLQDEIGNITVDQVLDNTTSASTNPVSSKAVYDAVTDNELVWTNAYVAMSGAISSHTEDVNIHLTSTQKENIDSLETNIDAISGITSTDITNWDNAVTNSHTHSNKTALDSITGNVGTMAYENTSSYSSATEVNTALGNKLGVSAFETYSGTVDTTLSAKASQSDLNTHTANTSVHVSQSLLDEIASLKTAIYSENGHPYVEIGGVKWATMNIGATSPTDYGQYFQWGSTTGFLSGDVGSSSTALKKPFTWADYKFGNGTSSAGASGMTKYNSGDTKTVLDLSDDTAHANWGGSWRMPTTEEFAALGNAVNTAWTGDYKSTGVAGIICTAKDGSGAQLFFPAAGDCGSGSVYGVGSYGRYWSGSLYSSSMRYACRMGFSNGTVDWQYYGYRFCGFSVRGVVG